MGNPSRGLHFFLRGGYTLLAVCYGQEAGLMNAEGFAGRPGELRSAGALSKQALAERAGLKRLAGARLETGRNDPAWRTVLALSKALGVTCEAFTREPADLPPP